ncbi:hypothetical protein [Paenibacillus aquistagni]|uniref:hypothetical protein n=1 Tax=Paenibacillus aquistagni TaxID=1852522 RepID=UPI0034DEFB6D
MAKALKYKHTPHMVRLIEYDEKDTVRLTDRNKHGNPYVAIISEFGIYEAVLNSEREGSSKRE